MNKISICLSSDNSYVQHLGATISSVLKSKLDDEYIKFYIIDGGISDENKEKLAVLKNDGCEIIYLKPNKERFRNCSTENHKYLTIASYYRILIPELIQEERVLYLDCDTIVRKSLKEFFNKDFGDNLLFASK